MNTALRDLQGHWAALRKPTLTRRVVAVLLGAVALCFAVLLGIDWLALRLGGPEVRALPQYTQNLLDSLPTAPPEHALVVLHATEQQTNRSRQSSQVALGPLLFQLQTADGTPRYASPNWPADWLWSAHQPPADGRIYVRGQTYWIERRHNAQWQLTVLEPQPNDSMALRWLGGELLLSFAIALPLLMLPLWWSVRCGLRPLRQLVHTVSQRTPDDASPLRLDLHYAELQPLVQSFEALLTKARTHIERERALTQDAAHELRTPLAVISTQAHLVCAASQPGQRAQAQAALEHAVQRASHLVHQLLTLAALDQPQPHTPKRIDVAEVARRLLIAALPRADARSMDLALLAAESAWAWLEPLALDSILGNLLDNAIHYGHDGGHIELGVKSHPADGERPATLQLSVADDGPGIPADQQTRLFQRFERGRHTREDRVNGSGLGLPIVAQAVQCLGGQLRLGPGLGPQGQGVRFDIYLPGV